MEEVCKCYVCDKEIPLGSKVCPFCEYDFEAAQEDVDWWFFEMQEEDN